MAWHRKPAWGSVWKEVFQHWWKLFSQTRPLAKFNSQIFSNSLKSLSFDQFTTDQSCSAQIFQTVPQAAERRNELKFNPVSANALSGGRETGNLCWTCQEATWKKNRARKTSGVGAGSGEQLDLFQEFLPILPAGGMRSKCSRTFQ